MKQFIFVLFFFCVGITISAQSIDLGKGKSTPRTDSIAKIIKEPTQYVATYIYTFAPDAEFPEDTKEGLTILQIGKRFNRFSDYNELRFDSICDEVSRKHVSASQATPLMLGALKQSVFPEGILIDKDLNKITVQRTAGLRTKKYQYQEDLPTLDWKLEVGDSIISGFKCNKASTRLFGRDYIAWYAPEIQLPYGPYKFQGLPGLILRVTDSANNFDWTLDGLEKRTTYQPIYLWDKKDIVKTDRETVRKIYKNYCADPVSALLSKGNVQIPEETKATVEPKPYNPIELE